MSLEERELERLVRTVVQEVLRQAAGTSAEAPVAMPSNPRLLVLLTADSTGLDVVLNQITRLQERSYDLAFCFPPEAKDCISPTTLHQA
ncbi:MAG TPA: hypothetical protein EYP85_08985, partial [Armatimonadetes bacterium]|nr:hypothetical protein [Armatimonadota bacterium]